MKDQIFSSARNKRRRPFLPQILYGRSVCNSWADAAEDYIRTAPMGLREQEQIVSPHRASPIVSLDMDSGVESRFLLAAGSRDCTISVFDLSAAGCDAVAHSFRPVAQSIKADRNAYANHGPTSIPCGHCYSPTAVQFYPQDTGAFVSTDSAGNLLVWDTNAFTPVFVTNVLSPGTSQVAIQTLALPRTAGLVSHSLAVLGCRASSNITSGFDDSIIRILDITSGTVVQQLTGHGKRSINTIQWLPMHDFILASGGSDATIRLWDVRKAGRGALLHTLDRCTTSSNTDTHTRTGIASLSTLNAPSTCTLQHSATHVQSHGGTVSSICFTPDATHLLSASTADGLLQLWDIRPGTSQGGMLLPTSFLGITDNIQYTPTALHKNQIRVSLIVTQSTHKNCTVWVSGAPTGDIIGYNVHGLGCPQHFLQGHLNSALSMTEQHNCWRIFSGDSQGMILGWAPSFSSRSLDDI